MLKIREYPTQEELKERFDYADGKLVYKYSPSFSVKRGTVAGAKTAEGYINITMNRVSYCAHRLVYIWHYGDIPTGMEIDHINRERDDNRIENLRIITKFINMWNTKAKGYFKDRSKWRAQIRVNNKKICLGAYKTEVEAHNAYLEAKKIYHRIEVI